MHHHFLVPNLGKPGVNLSLSENCDCLVWCRMWFRALRESEGLYIPAWTETLIFLQQERRFTKHASHLSQSKSPLPQHRVRRSTKQIHCWLAGQIERTWRSTRHIYGGLAGQAEHRQSRCNNTGRVDATTQKLEDIPPGFDLLLPGLCIEMRGSRLIYKIHKLPPASRSSFNKPDTSLYTIEADINRIQKLLSDVDSGFTPGGTWEMDVKNEIKSLREDIDCLDSAEMFWSTKEIVIDITSKLIKELVPKGIDCSQIRTALTRILFREYREGYPPYEGTKIIGTLWNYSICGEIRYH